MRKVTISMLAITLLVLVSCYGTAPRLRDRDNNNNSNTGGEKFFTTLQHIPSPKEVRRFGFQLHVPVNGTLKKLNSGYIYYLKGKGSITLHKRLQRVGFKISPSASSQTPSTSTPSKEKQDTSTSKNNTSANYPETLTLLRSWNMPRFGHFEFSCRGFIKKDCEKILKSFQLITRR